MSRIVMQAGSLPIVWSDEKSSAKAKFDWHQEVIQDPQLSWPTKLVAGYLLHAFRGGVGEGAGTAWPAQSTIAQNLQMCPATVKRAIRDLIKRGWLQRRRERQQGTNTYWPSRHPAIAEECLQWREGLRLGRHEKRQEAKLSLVWTGLPRPLRTVLGGPLGTGLPRPLNPSRENPPILIQKERLSR